MVGGLLNNDASNVCTVLQQIKGLFELLVRINIHSRFRSTRCKTMYSGVTGTFGPCNEICKGAKNIRGQPTIV
jgi:hypothetical protein